MTTKQVFSNAILILVNAVLSMFIFISINFSLLSPQKIHELVEESFVGFALKRLLFALLIALIATGLVFLIWILIKKGMSFENPSNGVFFKRQFFIFLLISLISVGFDLYSASSV